MGYRHSRRTHEGPSLASIITGVVCTATAMTATVWSASGEVMDSHTLTGTAGLMGLTVLVFGQTMARTIELGIVRERRGREQRARARAEAANTGVWIGPAGQRLEIRWDGLAGVWHVADPVSRGEAAWDDPEQIRQMVGELEALGFACQDDDATRGVRYRLDLMDDEPTQNLRQYGGPPFRSEVARHQWMEDETQVIDRRGE